MKKKIFQFVMLLAVVTFAAVAISSCKGSVKDSDIQAALAEKISSVPEMAGLTATVKDGVVTLEGQCKDDACKAFCETTVKGMAGVKSVVSNCTVAPPPVPVEVAADDPISKGVMDAIKDYTGVKADVKDGVVTLTGEIKKTELPKLMQSIMSLKPKKVDNQLTIK